jgi:VWFA-related protein
MLLLCGAAGLRIYAQGASASPQSSPVFRAESTLLQVRFHVTKDNRSIEALTGPDVVLWEDGEPRPLALFERGAARKLPVEAALLFDVNGWPGTLLPAQMPGWKAPQLDSLPEMRLAVFGADNILMPFSQPTRDPAAVAGALGRVAGMAKEARLQFGHAPWLLSGAPRGSISLDTMYPSSLERSGHGCIYSAAMAVARTMAAWPGDATRVIAVFSDGMPGVNNSAAPEEVVAVANQAGVAVYPVLLVDRQIRERMADLSFTAGRTPDRVHEAFLAMGEATGGLSLAPQTTGPNFLQEVLAKVAEHVRTEYVAGFRPQPAKGPPRPHLIEVRLRSEELGTVVSGTRVVVY